ncbi:MAG: undecaprenyl-diphosphatase UppP [Patescibacteria group bacterium]
MSLLQALVLGIIQGITEFFPVSSSGHLVVLPRFFNWPQQPLVFDTTVHLGTALALLIVFRNDIWNIVSSVFKDFSSNRLTFNKYSEDSKLGYKILVGSIPAGLMGYFFRDFFENDVRGLLFIVGFLLFGSVLMSIAEQIQKKRLLSKDELTIKQSFKVGIFQALALFPGVSRSGATISGGMILGLNREHATKFSFLLSVPIIIAAWLFEIKDSFSSLANLDLEPLVIGFLASFGTAIFAIRFLLKFVKSRNLYPFVLYRLVLAAIVLAAFFQ